MIFLMGPRQVGKTTAVQKLMDKNHSHYATADMPTIPSANFIVTEWQRAREIKSNKRTLILDEIQKIPRWSETLKALWDEDRKNKTTLAVWLLGSSALLIEKGLSESLTGRFETNHFPHWVYAECKNVFGATLDEFVKFGGYPKVYDLRDDEERANDYIQHSIIETTLGRDILTMHAIEKPALLRQLFWYISKLPAQIVSYEKILGSLQGKGNSATLVHYAELLSMAFILVPISKFSQKPHRTKKSIPKWIIPNNVLVDPVIRAEGLKNFTFENMVGAHLLNIIYGASRMELSYWREDNREIDFIVSSGGLPIIAIEVKSGRVRKNAFLEALKKSGVACPFLIVSQKNIVEFMSTTSMHEVLELK